MPEPLICVVEIPKGTRNKYEYDPELGGIKFDRLLMTAAAYAAAVISALVCLSEPTFPGCLIPAKAVGMFKMRDEKGIDDKIICVPLEDPNWNGLEDLDDLPALLREEITQFSAIRA